MTIVRAEVKAFNSYGCCIFYDVGEPNMDEALRFLQSCAKDVTKALVFRRKGGRKLKVILMEDGFTTYFSYAVVSGDPKVLAPFIAEAMKHAKPRQDGEARIRIKRLLPPAPFAAALV